MDANFIVVFLDQDIITKQHMWKPRQYKQVFAL